MKKILITGANGFVGKNLINKINNKEYKVFKISSKEGDLSNPIAWERLEPCNYLIHLAAKTFVPSSWNQPFEFIKNNILSTTNALDYCKKNNTKLILLSSYMYGNPTVLPTPEDHKICANNPYGLSKLISEEISNFYFKSMQTESIILRVFNLFGPKQPSNFLISQIISQIKNENKITVSSLTPKRDYLYIDDLNHAIIKSLKYTGKHRVFNIGMGISYSVEEIITIIKKSLNSKAIIENKNISRKMEIIETVANIKLAQKELKWMPKYSFEEGINELLKKEK
tara:strand:+ start:4008 stop:4856 length:849 start_codon:yes stop_codon:yes gene_type:complete